MKFEIIVQLQKDVLDPEARAIHNSLQQVGFNSLEDLSVTKRYVINFTNNTENPEEKAQEIAEKFLSNPVSQNFQIKRLSDG